MSNSNGSRRVVKPVVCECKLIQAPVAPCEILDGRGLPGVLAINGTLYKVEVIGELPPAPAEPIISGYRLTKPTGEAHDLCLVAGRLECTCGDYEFRRSVLNEDCKHCKAIRQLLPLPTDSYEPRVEPRYDEIEEEPYRCGACGYSDCDCFLMEGGAA